MQNFFQFKFLFWMFFFFFNLCLFIYLWLPWVFLAAHGLSRVAMYGLLVAVASLTSEHGLFSSCGSWA